MITISAGAYRRGHTPGGKTEDELLAPPKLSEFWRPKVNGKGYPKETFGDEKLTSKKKKKKK